MGAIRSRLYATFSFENRELGQDVWLSQIISVIQSVPGVVYVDVQTFDGIPEKTSDGVGGRRPRTPREITGAVQAMIAARQPGPSQHLAVTLARVVNGTIVPAQLAVLSPAVPDTLILNQAGQ